LIPNSKKKYLFKGESIDANNGKEDLFPCSDYYYYYYYYFHIGNYEKRVKECYSTVEEVSVVGKKTSSKYEEHAYAQCKETRVGY
jgi:hypothetical protein